MPDILADLDFKNVSRIRNLPSPQNSDEPARLGDLNSAIEGLAWKDSVRVATQGNINLNSPGATIDGITMVVGDRVLVRSQTTQSQNGIYIYNGASTPMTRSADANTSNELEQAVVTVEEGTSAGATFRQTQVNFTLDTDPVIWATFGTSAPPASETVAGIAEIATQAETDGGTDDQRIVTPLKLANWAGRIRKFTSTIGDGSSTQYDLTHNFNTRDVIVQVYKTSGNYDQVYCDVKAITTNAVRLNFSSAPASNSLRVIILA
jgi:hypothetical protein